jgi:1-aminocyclopropane-1-carboxylate deaminase
MMFGLFDLIKQGYFPDGSKILAIHTGGLQGIEGMNATLIRKKLPIIN